MPHLKQSENSDLCLYYEAGPKCLLIKFFKQHLIPQRGPIYKTLYMKSNYSFTERALHNSLHFKKYLIKPS